MSNPHWVRITPIENVPPREGRAVLIGSREIALFNLGPSAELGARDQFLATDNQCPHKGGPLCDGIVSGTTVVCPLHGQRFDLETGMPVLASQPACVATFSTRVENGIIFVDLGSAHKASEEVAA